LNVFRSDVDLLKAKIGPAIFSHPAEFNRIIEHLHDEDVEILWDEENTLSYQASKGAPGRIKLLKEMSYGALLHEYRHFLDHKAAHYPGIMPYIQDWKKFAIMEVRGYQEEIRLAKELGLMELIGPIQKQMGRRIRELKARYKLPD
jgi:hypothetical protein